MPANVALYHHYDHNEVPHMPTQQLVRKGRLNHLDVERVDAVDRPASRHQFVILKSEKPGDTRSSTFGLRRMEKQASFAPADDPTLVVSGEGEGGWGASPAVIFGDSHTWRPRA